MASVLVLGVACGVKKDPVPPLRRVPHPAEFTLAQQGSYVHVRGSVKPTTMNGYPIEEATLSIWRDERPEGGGNYPSARVFKESAELVATLRVIPSQSTAFSWQDSVADVVAENVEVAMEEERSEEEEGPLSPDPSWRRKKKDAGQGGGGAVAKEVFYGIEIRNERGRRSPFSKIERIFPKLYAEPPQVLEAAVTEMAVHLRWEHAMPAVEEPSAPSPPIGYVVLRHTVRPGAPGAGEAPPERLTPEPVEGNWFEDEKFRFDQTYVYRVRSVVPEGAESLDSETVTVTPIDVFPPAVPQGLSASVEEEGVRLFWFPNKEEDLAGYHVYRAGDDGAFARITAEPFSSTIFEDSTVEIDRRYRYRVTAVDGAGNESTPSESVERLVRAAPVF
ncbi:MAG: hypothetical protein JSV08_03165 [Acidobacteriota bacterium]|nr:MAG: hypothetical protein JSV08_03165 [Acidobacteriota bacterium]